MIMKTHEELYDELFKSNDFENAHNNEVLAELQDQGLLIWMRHWMLILHKDGTYTIEEK